MITAMFGDTRASLGEDENGSLILGPEFFSGEGLMTDHTIFGHPGGRLVAGCLLRTCELQHRIGFLRS
jgi:hypothetical protein